MSKIKNFLFHQSLKWKYSNDTVPLVARKSFKIGFGAMFIFFGTLFLYKNLSANDIQFKDVTSTPTEAFQMLEPSDKEKNVTLILYREDCPACKNVEKQLVNSIKQLKNNKTTTIIVADVNEMEQKQLQAIKARIPAVMINKNKIPTPLVANLVINTNGEIIVKEQSNTDDFKVIQKVLDQSF